MNLTRVKKLNEEHGGDLAGMVPHIEMLLTGQLRPQPLALPAPVIQEPQRTTDRPGDKPKKSLPRDMDVVRLAKRIKDELSKGGTREDIALDFAEGDEKKAERLLRQLRPDRHGYLLD
jgi:hypothetical protein